MRLERKVKEKKVTCAVINQRRAASIPLEQITQQRSIHHNEKRERISNKKRRYRWKKRNMRAAVAAEKKEFGLWKPLRLRALNKKQKGGLLK
jgi:hypothetical protein